MYQIATVSTQDEATKSLFARTDEWMRLIEHLQATRKGSTARMILSQIDQRKPTNTIVLPRGTAQTILREAGVSY